MLLDKDDRPIDMWMCQWSDYHDYCIRWLQVSMFLAPYPHWSEVSINGATPKMMVDFMENHNLKWMIWDYPMGTPMT